MSKHEQDHVDRFLEQIQHELPQLDLAVEGIVDRIGGIHRRLQRKGEAAVAQFGLTHGEWKVLNSLHRGEKPYRGSPGQLAQEFELSSGAMTNRLDRLEARGLVRRLPDPDDRRGVQVELTDEGCRVYEASIDVMSGQENQIVSVLTAREKEQLNNLLRKLMLEFERIELESKKPASEAEREPVPAS
jgi:DNA-binding MarR family transcriptional regulator